MGLSSAGKLFVISSDHRIPASRGECGHVEHAADGRSTAPDLPSPSVAAAVSIQGRDSYELGDLVVGELPEFGQFCQQSAAEDGTDARDTAE